MLSTNHYSKFLYLLYANHYSESLPEEDGLFDPTNALVSVKFISPCSIPIIILSLYQKKMGFMTPQMLLCLYS
jgi:hypothetical protein